MTEQSNSVANSSVSDRFERLAEYGLVYLASPYTKYEKGLYAAFREISRIAAELAKRGISAYSPIAYSHLLAVQGGISPTSHNFWMSYDKPFMRASGALLVAKMEGWSESKGVQEEILIFRALEKPIFYLSPESLEIS